MRQSFATMGTVVSARLDRPTSVEAAKAIFDAYDRIFSLYAVGSPLSEMARGVRTLAQCPEIVRDEYARAVEWRRRTSGWFTPHRPDGVLDLSGTIKAVALQAAARLLAEAGAEGMLGAGGDLTTVGSKAPTDPVGVVDPTDRTRLLTSVEVGPRRAVATSGTAERGDHIWSRLGRSDLVQVTVLADDIVTADVFATAIVAAGSAHLDELCASADIDVLAVTDTGDLLATPGLRRSLALPDSSARA